MINEISLSKAPPFGGAGIAPAMTERVLRKEVFHVRSLTQGHTGISEDRGQLCKAWSCRAVRSAARRPCPAVRRAAKRPWSGAVHRDPRRGRGHPLCGRPQGVGPFCRRVPAPGLYAAPSGGRGPRVRVPPPFGAGFPCRRAAERSLRARRSPFAVYRAPG